MLKATLQFFRDFGNDLVEAIRWFFSPDAWRIVLIVVANLGILAALGYVAIHNYDYSREAFSRCPGNKNLVFIGEFFAFTFFALFSLAAVGEVLNWVDAKRRSERPEKITALLIYVTLTTGCGALALTLLIRCS
ncbi:MAG: hypothetical protein IPL58_06200 [Betaproteobacteria bacterium]|uniref:Uncharacterized protein n=1 Tax=Candidatus Proximibacter danicus TaxID=2954365 RepID=A0A9D7PPW7_9PROT|nr:hypothetical protein [Candidatus Proximibacter danicus]MBK9446717.1 hypothetical protein [Betaproteobacteria bacterium]